MSIRVEDALHSKIEEAADGQNQSVSEWVRQLMLSDLGLMDNEAAWSAPTTLSKRERQQLVLSHRVIELLSDDDDEVSYHASMVEVLEKGFTAEYSTAFASIDDEMPITDCRLVYDIFDMFRLVTASVDNLGVDEVRALDQLAEHALTFRGFDFNDPREGRMASYGRYLIKTGRWTELAVYFDNDHERGNSHAPLLAMYERMLAVYTPIRNAMVHGANRGQYLLDGSALRAIVLAAYHPSQRPSTP